MRRTSAALLALLAAALGAAAAPGSARADEPKARVLGEMDRALRLEVQHAIGTSKTRPATRVDARRRARDAGEAAIAVLRSEGYYDYQVEPDVGEGEAPDPIVRITLGPRSLIASPEVVWDGAPPDAASKAAAEKVLALSAGAPGRAADVLAAEGRVVAALRKLGYADAAPAPRQVVVDHSSHTLEPTFHIAAGPLVRLDGLKVVNPGRTRPAWVAKLAPWKTGDVYAPAKVAELERRLREAGVYDSITVALAPPDQTVGGQRPVIVSLSDRKSHTIEVDAGYSTSEGAGGAIKWILYNRLRRADTITFTGRLAQIQQKLDGELDLPDWRRADQILKTGADVFSDTTKAFNDDGLGVRASVERHFTQTTFWTLGGAVDAVDTRENTAVNANQFPVGEHLKLLIFSTLGGFNLDKSNDPLNPTRGWRLQAQAEPTYVTGDRTLPYLKLQVQASAYWSLQADASTVIAVRGKLGSIIGGEIPQVPADRRFFAGGGGSVRGYNYQGIGPRLADGTPIGGDSLFESSFELRQHVSGPWGVAAFIDAGSLSPVPTPSFSQVAVGAGVGVRYNLGFAPVRVDIATPLDRHKGDPIVQLYFSLGQSF